MPGVEERAALADSVRRLLAQAGLPRACYGEAPDRDLWRKLADLGVVAALAPESTDGLGLALADVGGVLSELGRSCYSGPFIASAVGATTLLAGLADADLLPKVVSGDLIATVVDGSPVDNAVLADVLLVIDGDSVSVVHDFRAEESKTLDGSRSLGTVSYTDAQPLASDVAEVIATTRDRIMASWLADGLGAAQAIFDLAMEHAKTRVQFGVPIGSFQAVQHLLVDAFSTLQAGRFAVETALAAAEADAAERHRAVTMASAWCCDGFFQVAATAIAVLGGIGFTWEHDAQLYYKRLITLQTMRGGSTAALEELAALTL
ncbi:MAG: acyl-CoA dehydrogenase family protein [Actinomycetes bacterium]